MKIGLLEVRSNAFAFAARWKGVTEERAVPAPRCCSPQSERAPKLSELS